MKQHKFKQRAVGALKSDYAPVTWMFTDTETKVRSDNGQDKHFFYLGWCFLCHAGWEDDPAAFTPYFFDNSEDYLKFIERTARKCLSLNLVGHNIFFDLQASGFFGYFRRKKWQLNFLYDKGMTYMLKLSKGASVFMILSTTNWFDCSLRELGKMTEIRKGRVKFETVSDSRLKSYCYRDTEIVLRAMHHYVSFVRVNSLGRLRYSKASQSLEAYRRQFMQSRIFVHDSDEIHFLEREAYMGGRTEAYFIGELPPDRYVTLDVNGMYPYVMQKYLYPSKLVGYLEDEPDRKYLELLDGFLMIAHVELDTPEPFAAVRHKGKTVFPIGQFDCYLCTEGLRYARDRGYIKRFICASVYLPVNLFTGYVRRFSDLRTRYAGEKNHVMEQLCKYMHNTFYGKWGERAVVTQIYDDPDGPEYYRDEVYDMARGGSWIETWLMGVQILQHYEGETPHSAPAVAAHITENARMTLWYIMSGSGRDNVLYCDTDSIIVPEKIVREISWRKNRNELGALKVQSRYSKLRIDGAKNYRTDAARHIKGIPAAAKEVSPGVFEYMHFKSMCMCLREKVSEGVPFETVRRALKAKYDKGVVTSSGKVEPLVFPLPLQPPGPLQPLLPFSQRSF